MARPYLNRLAIAGLLMTVVWLMVGVGAAAKESQDYGLLTVQLIGADGKLRSFDARSVEQRQNARFLVQELDLASLAETVSSSPPSMSAHYQILVKQEPRLVAPLPWANLGSAHFYYYPGQGLNPALPAPSHGPWSDA
jgi:hypothetical protein